MSTKLCVFLTPVLSGGRGFTQIGRTLTERVIQFGPSHLCVRDH